MHRGPVARPPTDLGVAAANRAVLAIFFVDGAITATWATHVPLVQEKFHLGEGVLGLALLAVAVGSVVSLVFAGALVARLGSRVVTSAATLALCLTLALLALAPSFPLLVAALLLFGLGVGALDVAMNAQAVAVEARRGRPSMSTFHAMFSTGGLVGATAAGALLSAGIGGATEAVGVALVLGVIGAIALRALLPTGGERIQSGPILALPTGALLGLGILAFLSLLSEGAMADWSAVYLRLSLGTGAGYAATGYAAFSLAMALGRFVGDPLRAHLDAVGLLRLGGAFASAGLGVALILGQPLAALVGFACVGLGLANIVPVLFSAAGHTPGIPTGTAIAAVATVGYLGFLAGPPLIGFVAQAATLTVGLGLVVLSTALIVPLAGTVVHADGSVDSSHPLPL